MTSLILIFFGIWLAGCSTTTLPAGAALGNSGKAAATAMQQAAIVSPAELDRLMLSDAFLVPFYGNPISAAIAIRHDLIAKLPKELASRAALLSNLAATEDALASLASYDASGSYNTALNGFVSSANAYIKGAGLTPIPANDSAVIPLVGGLIASTVQKQMVRDASAKITPHLAQVITVMEKYQTDFESLRELIVSQGADTANVLYGTGLYSSIPLLNSIGAPYGYTALPSADKMLTDPKYRRVRAGLSVVQAELAKQRAALVVTAFDQSLTVLRRLKTQHIALENDQPLDLAALASDVTALQATINQLSAALALK
jgi:hypothetical protein